MLPPHLYNAILAHCTVHELHQFRTWNTDIEKSAKRQLQLRFPNLSLAHILKHTVNTLPDPQSNCDYNVSDHTKTRWRFVRWSSKLMKLYSLQHRCLLDTIQGNEPTAYVNIDDNFIVVIVDANPEFYIDIWDFQSIIQTHTIVITEDLFNILTCTRCIEVLVAPNRKAVWLKHAVWVAEDVTAGYVIQCDGVIARLLVSTYGKISWKENQLYSGDKLIYTIVS